jgi:polyisoprenoid-binding protein YceI
MKTTNYFLTMAAIGGLFLASCGGEHATEETTTETTETATETAIDRKVDLAGSKVNWTGEMIGIKAHFGTIALSEASVKMSGDKVVGGNFVANMSSITPLDENYAPDGSAQGTRAMLVGHLSSPDFFDIVNYPTASFEITGANTDGSLAGNLTLRGKTNSETVKDVVVDAANGTVTGTLTFDRKKYDVAWDSPMKDAVLSNDITLKVELKVVG